MFADLGISLGFRAAVFVGSPVAFAWLWNEEGPGEGVAGAPWNFSEAFG